MLIFLFGIIIILLVILTFVWPPDSPWSPWWRTDRKTAHAVCKLASVSKNDIVYELGSGDGEFCLVAGNAFHAKKVVGVEIEHVRHVVSKIRWMWSGKKRNIFFERNDFKNISLNDADVVYFYLVPAGIKRMLPKFQKELKKGTRIVSLRYPVELKLEKEDKKHNLFLYKI